MLEIAQAMSCSMLLEMAQAELEAFFVAG